MVLRNGAPCVVGGDEVIYPINDNNCSIRIARWFITKAGGVRAISVSNLALPRMCAQRIMDDGYKRRGLGTRDAMIRAMWEDCEIRMKKLGVSLGSQPCELFLFSRVSSHHKLIDFQINSSLYPQPISSKVRQDGMFSIADHFKLMLLIYDEVRIGRI